MSSSGPTRRLSPDQLQSITGKLRPSAQQKWFQRHYAVTIPADPLGPVITELAFEAMIAARCGIQRDAAPRPAIKLRNRDAKKSS